MVGGDLGRCPSVAELAGWLGMETVDVLDALNHVAEPVSLSGSGGNDGPELADVVPDTSTASVSDEAVAWAVRDQVQRLLALLDDRERHVVRLRIGLDGTEPRTLAAVAADLNLSVQGVAHIQKGAIAKLRRSALARGDCLRDLLAG